MKTREELITMSHEELVEYAEHMQRNENLAIQMLDASKKELEKAKSLLICFKDFAEAVNKLFN